MDGLVLSRNNFFVFIWTISIMFSFSECEPFIFWNQFKVNMFFLKKKIPHDFIFLYLLFVRVEGVTVLMWQKLDWLYKNTRDALKLKQMTIEVNSLT